MNVLAREWFDQRNQQVPEKYISGRDAYIKFTKRMVQEQGIIIQIPTGRRYSLRTN